MSWSRSSRLGLAALLLLALVAAVGVASAVSVTGEQAPEAADVGQDVTVTVNLTDLFAQQSSWQLNGQTELETAQWTVELYEGDSRIDTRESSGDQPSAVYLEDGVTDADRIVVTITGTAPEVNTFNYSDPVTFLAGEVVQITDGGNDPNFLSQQRTRLYEPGDPGSREARSALDDANATIQSAAGGGADVSEARSTFQDAVSAYNSGNFDEAVSLADEAASQAESAGSGSDDGGSSDGGGSTDGGSTDGSGSDTGGSTSDGGQSDGSESGDGNRSDADDGNGSDGADGGNASSSGGSDDGGLLMPILYGLLGLLILGAVGGGLYWYQQQNKGPSRDPLG